MTETQLMDDEFEIPLDPTLAEAPLGEDYSVADSETRRLAANFRMLVESSEVEWKIQYKLIRRLGTGGQGEVFLGDRCGSFGVTFRMAIKFFRTSGYANASDYTEEMQRQARVAMSLARTQQDHLLDMYNFVEFNGVHALTMEWVDGFDLRQLLNPWTLDQVKQHVNQERWDYLNDVLVTRTASQLRLKPGVAISILRECLTGVGALHRQGVVHADLKPANVMLKRTGNCKIIDFGSAFRINERSRRPTWTPRYAAPEVILGGVHTPQSDLCSLGYMLFEMLSGQYPFVDADDGNELMQAKRDLPKQLGRYLPDDILKNSTLIHLLQRLIAPDPADRYGSAEEANFGKNGASDFQRQLVRGNLSSEYENEIRHWLEEIR
ncbi:MAG: serine/threonine-protein kinase [Planctomycetaceae bacterium]